MILWILSKLILVAVLTNRVGEISVGPKFASPKLLLNLGATSEYFSGSLTFYHFYNFSDPVGLNGLKQKMNMILSCDDFKNFFLISFFDSQSNFFQNLILLFINNHTPVFCSIHQMIYQYCYGVTLMYLFAYTPILRRRQRGYSPERLKIG